jgi:hypothetical protein
MLTLTANVLHRQGKNLERTTKKRSIKVTVNGDSQIEQESASMRTTKLSKAGERRPTIQQIQQQGATHNQNQDTPLH